MTKVQSNQSKVNQAIQPKDAKSVTFTANQSELKEIGGVGSLIQSVNLAIQELQLMPDLAKSPSLKNLEWLRDNLIKNNYDQSTYNLIELLLSEKKSSFIRPTGEFNEENFNKHKEACNKVRERNIALSKLLKPKAIDLNKYFDYEGGVASLVKCLTNSIQGLENQSGNPTTDPDIFLLTNLRDTLVREHYGEKAFALFESLTM